MTADANTGNDDDDTPIQPDSVVQSSGLTDAVRQPRPSDDDMEDPLAALLGGGPAGTGGLDVGALMAQASNVQAQLIAAQEQAQDTVVEGVAGGGAVKVEVTGGFEFRSVIISPEAVDPGDVEMLQDLVLAALHDAVDQVQELQSGGLDLGGLDLGGLLGGG